MASNNSHSHLFRLPLEIQWWILRYLDAGCQASFLQTCHRARDIVEPLLYHKVFTKIGTHNDTAGLVEFLLRRPHVAGFIHFLVLDEFHPVAYRQLMSTVFPNLESIIMQHDGEFVDIDEKERQLLNEHVKEQPNLTNLTFSIEKDNWDAVTFAADDATLFRHKKLRRMRISYIDFSAFGELDADYFQHSNLRVLFFELCWYNQDAMARLVAPTGKLQNLLIGHNDQLPFSEKLYPTILAPARESLRILDLTWRWKIPIEDKGMDFTQFPNLHFLRVPPVYLLGSAYMDDAALPDLIRTRFPPNLKMLLLENIVPRSIRVMNERGVVFPGYPPPGYTLELTLMPRDYQLIRFLITEKHNVLPRLKYVLMYYMEFMQDPADLYPLAKENGVTLGPLLATDYVNPLLDWLDEL
ncbi:uncharacterized protein GGS22DRAFT_67043 [Annulohypoxylon maeteangense]|uniref:uncharacterized protein n=1 Tax=Annulohypoxylon maeteangense TaxID=1927788 RepID=UPI002007696B|nr:uncharacterized protein GGS22DRAFT_67043 [Annulohypoxylon maeteangense]KAI0889082.1 hypothetical protein GGS22DRAFT_67043 [Annulohypoxylon maeteangense]